VLALFCRHLPILANTLGAHAPFLDDTHAYCWSCCNVRCIRSPPTFLYIGDTKVCYWINDQCLPLNKENITQVSWLVWELGLSSLEKNINVYIYYMSSNVDYSKIAEAVLGVKPSSAKSPQSSRVQIIPWCCDSERDPFSSRSHWLLFPRCDQEHVWLTDKRP
jgi:hypothetical protein